MAVCTTCERELPLDRFNPTRGSICFACHVKGVGFGYVDPGGRKAFHGPTITERRTRAVAEARANGLDPVPAWHKPYTGR